MKLFFALLLTPMATWAMMTPLKSVQLYVPVGFDDNDAIEVMAVGSLPDTCHQAPSSQITRTGNRFIVSMNAQKVKRPDCRTVRIPFTEKISLGTLQAGEYTVTMEGKTHPLTIATATSSLRDEKSYANVTAIVEEDEGRRVWLIGTHPSSCVREKSVELARSGNDVWVIMPEVEFVGECLDEQRPFKIAVEIPFDETMRRGVLLHVRIMDGRSLNLMFQNLARR